jgi:hypothetical protein
MPINKPWHLKHRMPKDASFEERIKWHIAHAKNCSCRPVPGKLKQEMGKRGVKL